MTLAILATAYDNALGLVLGVAVAVLMIVSLVLPERF